MHRRIAHMAAEALIPTSPDEVAKLFGEAGDVVVFGGGTILLREIAAGRFHPAHRRPGAGLAR